MGVVNCHVTTVDSVLHVHSKMQRTLFDFCSSQTEDSDRVSDAESSLSLISSDQDPVGDTHTDTLLLKPPLNPLKSLLRVSARQGIVNQISQIRSILDATIKSVSGQKRSVNASWFDRYPWLTLCETRNVLLCHYCVEADRWKLITFSTKEDAFMKSGFSRWKNAHERFGKHEAASTHKEAVLKIKSAASEYWSNR